ncbi:hypothetical protein G3580_02790 [Nitrogeniibacter mangrovi]|uniref:Uncharacterized protein n=1 Tax=Nitrogeniibacter mangrovi TaxID=2016596 RepID=A0A6C1B2T2_9RHOO|nr:hypothetical protein [Nitrogeniibacter mangrovi]QID16650.1 hypothetical protein G3580_02790 [Nitrogeniibacter mangrovi]
MSSFKGIDHSIYSSILERRLPERGQYELYFALYDAPNALRFAWPISHLSVSFPSERVIVSNLRISWLETVLIVNTSQKEEIALPEVGNLLKSHPAIVRASSPNELPCFNDLYASERVIDETFAIEGIHRVGPPFVLLSALGSQSAHAFCDKHNAYPTR